MRKFLFGLLVQFEVAGGNTERFDPALEAVDPFLMDSFSILGAAEILHLHLFEFTGSKDKVTWRDLIAKRFADLRNAERQLAARGVQHVRKIDENALSSFGPEVSKCVGIVISRNGANGCLEHQVEFARFRQAAFRTFARVNFCMKRTLNILKLVEPKPFFALAAIYQRVMKCLFMSGIFPYKSILDDRGIEALDIVALIYEPVPPAFLDVVCQLDTKRAVVP